MSIVALLFISGMISFFELSHLSNDTEEILKANQRNIELAKQMLDEAHVQNMAFIRLTVYGDRSCDRICRASMDRLEKTLAIAQSEAFDKSFLDSLAFATTEMRLLMDSYRALLPDTAGLQKNIALVYDTRYEALYDRMISAIKNYMTSTQSSLAPRTEQLKTNAYRAVTPVLISLTVMIAIVLMLYFFMMIYCVNPILAMNRSLGDWLAFRIPFAVKSDPRDEMLELKEKIETVVSLAKQSAKP